MTGVDRPLRLVVDTSVLVAELLRVRGRERLANPALDLFIPEETWGEVRHELPKRVHHVASRAGLPPAAGDTLLADCITAIRANIAITLAVAYSPLEAEARWRIARDERDWPIVALALALGADIWAEDGDFLGCGLPVWTTGTLTRLLREIAAP
jgi:predicted nucleic acid-binding protein